MPTLILLGAAGGALRGLLDVYTRFLDWRSDRRAHFRLPLGQEDEPPRFQKYFDPVGDPVAAVVHSLMGAGAAVLFGTTGQITGAYAAIVVGVSAPVILTQLSRIQSVSDALTGQTEAVASPGAGKRVSEVDSPSAVPASLPTAANSGDPVSAPPTSRGPQVSPVVSADGRRPRPDARVGLQPDTGQPHVNGRPADATGGPGRGLGGLGTPPVPRGPVVGEEETT
ncbi:hypothetical protein [Streptomyces sp. NPDC007264]|uniref:hypothetical protein n=1 Tax=Streptomyces sp. NPDC007264 TaxID=3364777 RepID=UPI0036D82E8C